MIISLAVLLLAYILYGRWIVKKLGVDPKRKTPAYEQRDGVDYEPAPKSVVFGHQFASIACAVFLKKIKKVRWFMYIPLGVMLAVTFTALGMTIYNKATALITASSTDMFGYILQLVFATLIIIIGICVVIEGFKNLFVKENNLEEEKSK